MAFLYTNKEIEESDFKKLFTLVPQKNIKELRISLTKQMQNHTMKVNKHSFKKYEDTRYVAYTLLMEW